MAREHPASTDPKPSPKESRAPARRKRRRGRRLLLALGALIVLLAALVALAPTIASRLAPGIIESQAAAKIQGRVRVGAVSLSWTGPQRVRELRLLDPDGAEAAQVSVSADAGLFALATGNYELGEIVVTGHAIADRAPDGRTILERAIEPRPAPNAPAPGGSGPGSGSGAIPPSLRADVRIDSFELRSGATTVVLDANASVAPGSPMTVNATATEGGRSIASIDATLTDLISADGALTLDLAAADASAQLTDAPTAVLASIAEALAPMGVNMPELLGERVNATLRAVGAPDALDATVSLDSPGVTITGAVRKSGALVEQAAPIEVTADAQRLSRAIPALRDALEARDDLEITRWPTATLRVTSLSVPLDTLARGDLRAVGANVELRATPAAASVTVGEGAERQTRAVAIDGFWLNAAAPDLAGEISLQAGASATLDASDAGDLAIALSAPTLLDGSGALLDPAAAPVSGSVALQGVAAETLQPFLGALGIVASRDIGPTLTARASATQSGDSAGSFELVIEAANVNAEIAGAIDGRTIRVGPRPGTFSIAQPAALVRALMGDAGASLERLDGPVTLTIESLSADLDRLAAETPDLRAVSLSARAQAPAAELAIGEGESRHSVGVSAMTLAIDASELGAGVDATLTGRTRLDAADAGALSARAQLRGLLDDAGALATDAASLEATAELTGVPAASLQPFLPEGALDLGDDVGPSLSATLTASKAPGAEAPINVDVRAGGERASLVGALALAPDAIRTRGGGVTLTQRTPGRFINRLGFLPEGMSVARAGSAIEMVVESLSVPRTADGGIDLAGATLSARGGIAGVSGPMPEGGSFSTGAIALTLSRRAGAPAEFSLKASDVRAQQGGDSTLSVVGALDAGGTADWSIVEGGGGTASAAGELTLDDAGGARLGVATFDARAPVGTAGSASANLNVDISDTPSVQRALGLGDLLTGTVGRTLTLSAAWAAGEFDPANAIDSGDARLSVQSPRLRTSGPVRVSASGGALRTLDPARLTWNPDRAWLSGVLFGEGGTMSLAEAVSLDVRVDRLSVPMGEGGGELDVAAAFASGAVTLALQDGARLEYTGLEATASTTETPGTLDVRATMRDKGASPDAPASVELVGAVSGLSGEAGLSAEAAVVTGYANLREAPTAVIDQIAGMDGLLVSFLGDRSSAHIRARGLSRTAGGLTASAQTDNASATFEGHVRDGSLVSTKPTRLTVNRITRDFGFELAKIVPIFGSIEKSAQRDQPATVVIDSLSVPVDGRDVVSGLSARMTIDPGDATLRLDGGVGKFLNVDQGVGIGRRLQAFPVNVDNGVVRYERIQVPVGEFTLGVSGTVDLANQRQDVNVALPAGALVSELARGQGPLGQIFDQAVGVRLENKGELGSKGWELKFGR